MSEIRMELSAIKRLSKNEFENLNKEQQEQYTSLIERLAAKTSILFKNSSLHGTKNAHIILDAISEAKKFEEKKKFEQMEKIKNELIQKQNDESFSIQRILFQFKNLKLKNDDSFLNFLPKTYFLKDLKLNENKLKIYSILLKDLKNINFSDYLIEECILYADSPENYATIKSNLNLIDPVQEKKRKDFEIKKRKTKEYNDNLKSNWDQLTNLEKLKRFCKENFEKEFDEIIEKGKILNLSESKIQDIIISNSSNILMSDFKSLDEIPFKELDENNLKFLISEKISNELRCPENLLINQFSYQELKVGSIKKQLQLDFIDQFKDYWQLIEKKQEEEKFLISKI
eukprot:gene12156-5646_t